VQLLDGYQPVLLGNPLINSIGRFHSFSSPGSCALGCNLFRFSRSRSVSYGFLYQPIKTGPGPLETQFLLTRVAFPLFSVLSGDVTTVFRFPPGIAGKAMFFSQGFCRRLVYLR
jgi:hypothetical protein